MDSNEKKQFNVYLTAGFIREVKRAALESDQSLSAFVETALRQHIATLQAESEKKGKP